MFVISNHNIYCRLLLSNLFKSCLHMQVSRQATVVFSLKLLLWPECLSFHTICVFQCDGDSGLFIYPLFITYHLSCAQVWEGTVGIYIYTCRHLDALHCAQTISRATFAVWLNTCCCQILNQYNYLQGQIRHFMQPPFDKSMLTEGLPTFLV